MKGTPTVFVSTRKGAFILTGDASQKKWKVSDLETPLGATDSVALIQAFSGG